ncbi:hypothetical protein IE53DRAFT_51354 [Violaceomyces palustris]|uniref:Uncharacterized protein n=1 Tax=Violaceomyces palustris TaxID=1673888 RepID=A0ACD0NZW3_9BASI|nr:hypothetical protein IE53DRAFT_51354 [Violaceomyces palustris]
MLQCDAPTTFVCGNEAYTDGYNWCPTTSEVDEGTLLGVCQECENVDHKGKCSGRASVDMKRKVNGKDVDYMRCKNAAVYFQNPARGVNMACENAPDIGSGKVQHCLTSLQKQDHLLTTVQDFCNLCASKFGESCCSMQWPPVSGRPTCDTDKNTLLRFSRGNKDVSYCYRPKFAISEVLYEQAKIESCGTQTDLGHTKVDLSQRCQVRSDWNPTFGCEFCTKTLKGQGCSSH